VVIPLVEFSVESTFGGVPAMCALFRWGAGRPWLRRPAREGRAGTKLLTRLTSRYILSCATMLRSSR
jgi:hypothetical protein